MPHHLEIVCSNAGDAIAICGWELKRAKLACALKEGRVTYALSLTCHITATLANHGCLRGHAYGRGWTAA